MNSKIAQVLIESFLKENKSKIETLLKDKFGNIQDNPYYDLLKGKFGDKFEDLLKDVTVSKEKEEPTKCTDHPSENTCYSYDSSNCRYVSYDVPGFEKSDIKITQSKSNNSLTKNINIVTNTISNRSVGIIREGSTFSISMLSEETIVETKLKNGVLTFKIQLPVVEPIEIKID